MDRRRESRIPVELPGSFRLAGGEHWMFYSQISAHGCRISSFDCQLEAGAVIAVSLGPIGPLDASVRWVKEGLAGVEFHSALEPEIVSYFAAIVPRAA